ncbi:uncharacterized protein SPSK_06877 [Sporothrix schenckii 1099-18]|uniref:Uncharacterized protein n=2 Tax=Sporothrix schenckii TaxID=29908 RepID=U7Q1P9_SPOS1|nr:uncharacterized protein SPSK_06877 [Sporothrix schenckii 1099-18]ERT00631.1 hypothetical protein HMPREF1624_01858 [Sporothrix schenckii ATCC 58251]KJR87694.1 hypothetical protein SPSK_06877 [Sporothrix schenckii 1099-18]
MNRFRTKKKVKEDQAASAGRASSDEAHSFMGFRRNKKAPEEEKKQIDISAVLPPSDDFRTSLLMTGLSARFSMLREQDDPSTKIGKALDDSVLFPKRQSRLMDFSGGFHGLDDIAEVESIRAPPPFMRTNSFASDNDSLQNDSIMNRTRPTDGNNLFGGRQKIYRIPAGGASSKNVADGSMGGRALYESDVALSAFQKLRQEKKEKFLDYEDDAPYSTGSSTEIGNSLLSADVYDPSTSSYQHSESPSPIEYSLRRETSSTTSSAARNSTAATSVTSQPGLSSAKEWQSPQLQSSVQSTTNTSSSSTGVERMPTSRIRRLYEQGLNQDLHEQQSSALSRIDTLTGKRLLRTKTPDLSATPSPTSSFVFPDRVAPATGTVMSTLERLERRQVLSKASAPNLRSLSPPMSGSSVGSVVPPVNESAGPNVLVGVPESKNTLPGSPPLSPPVSDSGGEHTVLKIQPNDVGKATALGMFQKPALPYDESRFAERQLQLQQGRETPTERTRPSLDAAPSSSSVPSAHPASKAPSVTSNEDPTKARTTFLFDDEDDEDEIYSVVKDVQSSASRPQVVLERPSDADHPAFRQSAMPPPLSPTRSTENFTASAPDMPQIPESLTEAATGEEAGGPPADSPTLGPGGGLSGMVLQHLRSTSNASSVYSYAPQNNEYDPSQMLQTSITSGSLDLKNGQPWDDQNWTASVYSSVSGVNGAADKKDPEPEPELPALPQQPLPKTPTQRPPIPEPPKNVFADTASSGAPSLRSVSSRSRITSVADSNRSSNNLDADHEDDDFASQLANARKRVQERLTTYVESDSSRNTSPLLAPTELPTQPPPIKSNPLGILRAKSSRGALLERSRDVSQTKSTRMLGLGASTMSTAPSSSKQSFEDNSSPAPTPPISSASATVNEAFSLEALEEERDVKPRPSQEGGYFGRMPTSASASANQAPTITSPSNVPSSAASVPRSSTDTDANDADEETDTVAAAANDDNNMHPGLRAFRNARRQLQKRKELETLARHQGDDASGPEPGPASTLADKQSPPGRERRPTVSSGPTSAPTSSARKPPPVYYQQRDPSQESRGSSSGNRSRSASRTSGPTERDRSGSETSNGGSYTRHAPPRIRANQTGPGYDDYQYHQPSPNSNKNLGPPARQGVPMRSPGLPGTDIRRSPHMPPQTYPGSTGNGPSSNNLSVQTAMGGRSPSGFNASSGQPSPISPLGSAGLPTSPYFPGSANASGPSTPTSNGPRMQQRPGMPHQHAPPPSAGPGYGTTSSSLNEAMKKSVRKNEISEPTFLMSTSRVPTVNLQQSTSAPEMEGNGNNGNNGNSNGSRSRSGSRARAPSNAPMPAFVPPLPPINPLRKQPGGRGPRGMLGGLVGGSRSDSPGDDMDTMSALSMPTLPHSATSSSTNLAAKTTNYQLGGSVSDNEDARYDQHGLRKQASEASGMHSRMMGGGMPVQRMDLPGGMI